MIVSLREIIRYGAGTVAAFAADMAVLAFLVEVGHIHYLVAATVSFLVGTAIVYWVSIRFAFTYRRVEHAHLEFGVFAAIGAVGILVNLGAVYLAVDRLHLHYLVGKVLSGAVTFCINFGLRRIFLFTPDGRREVMPSGGGTD
jgi:putative flippase GtrA